jgi:hypothetical protein
VGNATRQHAEALELLHMLHLRFVDETLLLGTQAVGDIAIRPDAADHAAVNALGLRMPFEDAAILEGDRRRIDEVAGAGPLDIGGQPVGRVGHRHGELNPVVDVHARHHLRRHAPHVHHPLVVAADQAGTVGDENSLGD